MSILLTGATGFVGRHVLSLLLERGATVISYGRARPEVNTGNTTRLSHISGDLSTGSGLTDVPWSDVEQVVHLAAAGVKASRRAWPEALAVNVVGTQRLFDAITKAPRSPLVFLARTFYEDLVTEAPILLENPYIATKHAALQIGRIFATSHAGEVIFGNFYQVYGPGDDPSNVLNYAAREFKAGRVPVFGSGQALRDWIFITDAAAAVVACIQGKVSGDYDIGSSKPVSVREMIETLSRIMGTSIVPVFDPAKDRGDQALTLLAKKTPLLWKAEVEHSQGLHLIYKNL